MRAHGAASSSIYDRPIFPGSARRADTKTRMRTPRGSGNPGKGPSEKRRMVDDALHTVAGVAPQNLYFAAVELNGSGIGFYGDCCLVLKVDPGDNSLTVLDRNSYDLIREPLASPINANNNPTVARAEAAQLMSGAFGTDLPVMAAIKVLGNRPLTARLMTTGIISTAVLEDEDYLEVLKTKTFGPQDIEEVRLSAADVAQDERIRSRSVGGLPPTHAELLWRRRRRIAEARLAREAIPIRVVTSAGRSRG